MWDGFNKRKFPRLALRCELSLTDQIPSGKVIRTQTQNVGAGGVCVILEQAIDRLSVLSLRLEIDPHLPWIQCLGKVMWSVPSRDVATKKQTFDTGIEFLDLQPAEQELIRHYVAARLEPEEKVT